jgi:solute carrier family 25 protein 42
VHSLSEHSRRLAASQPSVFAGVRAALRSEGVPSLFRGMSASMIGILPYAGLSWMTFEELKAAVASRNGTADVSTVQRMCCGATAGLIAQTVTYPLDMARRRMQTDGFVEAGGRRYTGVFQTVSRIAREEGLRQLFKGVTMNWIKGPIAVSISFTVNDLIKKRFGVDRRPSRERR